MRIWTKARWRKQERIHDRRKGRLVFLIKCLSNQNARDPGAAESPAMTDALIKLLNRSGIGIAQIPCPELACLGCQRQRPQGISVRQALAAPRPAARCRELAIATAERIECYISQGYEVLAVLGGNEQSPGCAVHGVTPDNAQLTERSGIFMQALGQELSDRGLAVSFCGMRDATPELLREDLDWLRNRIAGAAGVPV